MLSFGNSAAKDENARVFTDEIVQTRRVIGQVNGFAGAAPSGTPIGMGATKAAKTAKKRRAPRRKAQAGSAGLEPAACVPASGVSGVDALEERVRAEGGCVVGHYLDPLGGEPQVFAVLPIGTVEPTPFQRDLSDTHHKRLADVIQKTGRFLDPIIAITAPKQGFWTPNGRHRLEAMRRLGAKSITALVVPAREVRSEEHTSELQSPA